MAKTRITKRALVACVLALALSVSAFVGVTFAWFTDSVSSGVNKIISGNLDIGLNYWDADSGKYEDATNVELFDKNALWEPGHVEVAYLEIENRGSLSFSYLFTVYALRETEGYLKSGEAFYLSDYLTYAIASYDVEKDGEMESRDEALALVESSDLKLTDKKYQYGDMHPDSESVRVALIVYMPEHVTSAQANHDMTSGKPAPELVLAVDLYATQNAYEFDSFDDQYDSGLMPTWGESIWKNVPNGLVADETAKRVTVSTAQALKYLGTLFETMSKHPDYEPSEWEIVLGDDIDFGGETLAEPISFGGFKRFNGNNKTIYNVIINYILVDENVDSIGLFDELPDTQDLTVKNVTVKSETTAAGALAGKLTGTSYSNITVEDSSVSGVGYVGGFIGYGSLLKSIDLSGCCLFRTDLFGDGFGACYAGGFAGYIGSSGSVEVSNATVSGLNASGVTNAGSYVGGMFGALEAEGDIGEATITEITIYKDVYIGSVTGKVYDTKVVKLSDSTLAVQAKTENGETVVMPFVSDGKVEESNVTVDPLELPTGLSAAYNGHYYMVIKKTANWHAAGNDCASAGGYLASITSADEQAVVAQIVNNSGEYSWIGGSRSAENRSVFVWKNGEKITYSNWSGGEPNNWDGIEDVIFLYTSGKWNDGHSNNSLNAYVCEWDSLQSYLNYLASQAG